MKSEVFIDQIDAEHAAADFLDEISPPRQPRALQSLDLCMPHGPVDGRIYLLWGYANKLIGQAIIVRDDMNRSVLTCVDLRENSK